MKSVFAVITWMLLLHFVFKWTIGGIFAEPSFIEESMPLSECAVGCSSMIALAIFYKKQ